VRDRIRLTPGTGSLLGPSSSGSSVAKGDRCFDGECGDPGFRDGDAPRLSDPLRGRIKLDLVDGVLRVSTASFCPPVYALSKTVIMESVEFVFCIRRVVVPTGSLIVGVIRPAAGGMNGEVG
jgi:hypothetical protein